MEAERRFGMPVNWFYAMLAITLLLLVPIWYFKYLPLNDWPNHLASISLLARGDAGLSTFVQANPNLLLPNSTAFWFMRILGPFVGVETAGRLLLSLTAILMVWGAAYFMRSIDEKLAVFGAALGAAMALNWFFLMGFLNYALSIPLFLITAGYWMQKRENAGANELAVGLCLAALTALTHLIAGLVLVELVVVWKSAEALNGFDIRKPDLKALIERKLHGIWMDMAVIIPCIAITALSIGSLLPEQNTSTDLAVWGNPISKIAYLIVTPPNPAIGLMAVLVLGIYLILMAGRMKIKWRPDMLWLLMALGLAATGMLAPENTATWQFAAPRAWPFFIFFAAAAVFKPLCNDEKGKGLAGEMAFALVLITLTQTAILCYDWQDAQSNMQAVVSASEYMREGAAAFPIGSGFAMSGRQISVSPYFHAWGYWTIDRQIYSPYVFSWSYSPVQMKNATAHAREEVNGWLERLAYKGFAKPTNDSCKYWKEYYQEVNWSLIAREYDYVVMRTDKCEEGVLVPQPPFVQIYENGPVYLFENSRNS